MNDDELKSMMNAGIEPPGELAKRRTQKESGDRFFAQQKKLVKDIPRWRKVVSVACLTLLVGVVATFFTAVPYIVTQSTRSGAGHSDNETSLINSAQFTQYPAGLRTAVVRMIISGADVSQVEFNVPSESGGVKSGVLDVFSASGGGATYAEAPADLMADGRPGLWRFNAENEVRLIGSSSENNMAQAENAELIAFLSGISETVCRRINSELGLPDGSPNPVPVQSGIDTMTNMSFSSKGICQGGCGGVIGAEPEQNLSGQPFGCFMDSDRQQYVYYHVLVER